MTPCADVRGVAVALEVPRVPADVARALPGRRTLGQPRQLGASTAVIEGADTDKAEVHGGAGVARRVRVVSFLYAWAAFRLARCLWLCVVIDTRRGGVALKLRAAARR